MVDIVNPPEPESPSGALGITQGQKYALVALGGLAFVALALTVLAARQRRGARRLEYVPDGPIGPADWEASLRHFAQAVDARMAGFQQQLDAMHVALGTDGPRPTVSETLPFNGNAPANQTYDNATADQEENVPPAPAAISLPPGFKG